MSKFNQKIKVGISSCLAGQNVRYDGGHKLDANIIKTLGELFELQQFCPEMEIGLGVPREPIRLVYTSTGIRCVGTLTDDLDVTDALAGCADQRQASDPDLCGYVFKARSPSCGLQGVAVWQDDQSRPTGTGVFASRLQKKFIGMPMTEEKALADPTARARFVQQVKSYHRRLQYKAN